MDFLNSSNLLGIYCINLCSCIFSQAPATLKLKDTVDFIYNTMFNININELSVQIAMVTKQAFNGFFMSKDFDNVGYMLENMMLKKSKFSSILFHFHFLFIFLFLFPFPF